MTSGIPQGSVLGPILFVIYINDLPDNIQSNCYMFADDTKVFKDVYTIKDMEILQHDMQELEKWSNNWLLKFHPTNVMCYQQAKETYLNSNTHYVTPN